MVYGDQWTGARVIARLVEAFRQLPATPIYAPSRARIEPAPQEGPVDGADLILLSADYLGRTSRGRVQLLTFARAYAAGESIVAVCRQHGWARAGTYRRVRRAADRLAAALNVRHVVPN
jgi:hypothetical protein